ncbi:MAG: YceI family protein [Phenylobacterium sp.]
MQPKLILAAALAVAVTASISTLPFTARAAADPALGPDAIPAGTYVIDTKETQARYTTNHMGFTEFSGIFPGAAGTMTIDPKQLVVTKLEVTVPVAGLETTNRELDHVLFSDQFFDGDKFPRLKFVSTAVTRTGPRTAKVVGDLTLHGITRPVTLDVTFNGAGPNSFKKNVLTLGFRAEGVVKRSDFGMGKYVPIVSDETAITISAAFEKTG